MSNDQDDDHADSCMARHHGFACTCEQLELATEQAVTDTDVLLTKRLTDLVIFAEKAVTMLMDRVGSLDTQLVGRVHERELLARAAELIDPDGVGFSGMYEARLDWLAKWREVTAP